MLLDDWGPLKTDAGLIPGAAGKIWSISRCPCLCIRLNYCSNNLDHSSVLRVTIRVKHNVDKSPGKPMPLHSLIN